MTLSLSLVSQEAIVQVSDRRFTDGTGAPVDDVANKAIVVACTDAVLSITFTGLASFTLGRGEPQHIDVWLAHAMLEKGIPELNSDDLVAFIAEAGGKLFSRFPSTMRLPLTFIVSGWIPTQTPSKEVASVWTVTNDYNGRIQHDFSLEQLPGATGRDARLYAVGMQQALTRPVRRRMEQALRRAKRTAGPKREIDEIETVMVRAIREAADTPESKQSIGKNCTAVTLLPQRQARSTYHTESQTPVSYGPTVLWDAGTGNALMTDIGLLPGSGYRVIFGGEDGGLSLVVGGTGSRKPISKANPFEINGKFMMGKYVTKPAAQAGDEALILRVVQD